MDGRGSGIHRRSGFRQPDSGRLAVPLGDVFRPMSHFTVCRPRWNSATSRSPLTSAPQVDVSALPTERRVRHVIELARAYSAWNRRDEALSVLLDAEQQAPEQVRHHIMSRQLVRTWVRQGQNKPQQQLADLASRLPLA